MTTLIKLTLPAIILVFISSTFVANTANAHCKAWHPNHCAKKVYKGAKKGVKKGYKKTKKVAKKTYRGGKKYTKKGVRKIKYGVKKRARIVWKNPGKAALNPLKVISPSIPNPISIAEFTLRHPSEILKVAKNPVTGIIGAPLATLITEGRNSALMAGTKPIPPHIKKKLSKHFNQKLLNSVRYRVGNSFGSGLPQSITLHYKDRAAVTFLNVIVFKNKKYSNELSKWAHEVYHVQQYKKLGLYKFATMYTLDSSSIEKPAYRFEKHVH